MRGAVPFDQAFSNHEESLPELGRVRAAVPKENSDLIGLSGGQWPNPATGKETGSMMDLAT